MMLKTFESDFDIELIEPKLEEFRYKPSNYSLMSSWPIIENKVSAKPGDFFIYSLITLSKFLGYAANQIDKIDLESYIADHNDLNSYEIKNDELNFNRNNFNVDYCLNKLTDLNFDNFNDELVKSQLKELKFLYKKEINLNGEIKIVSEKFPILKIKENMIRLLDVSNELSEYFKYGKKIHSKYSNAISSYWPEPVPFFSGRTTILQNIEEKLNEKQIIVLIAFSGTGKSAIANQYGMTLKNQRDYTIIWIESDDDFKLFREYQILYKINSNKEINR